MRQWLAPRKERSFKEKMNMAIYSLKAAMEKLQRNSERLKRRDSRFFNKCIEAQIKQNNELAVIYANECAQIRKLAKLVLSSELALEKAIIRLQTISELSDVVGAIAPVLGLVHETKGRLKGIIPSVTGKLDEVTGILNSSMKEMGSVYTSRPDSLVLNKETEKILREANTAAEERIREKFPELPEGLPSPGEAEAKIAIALTASGMEAPYHDNAMLKRKVYDYIKSREGKMSLVQCASYLGVFPTDVEEAILRLKEEGKIILE